MKHRNKQHNTKQNEANKTNKPITKKASAQTNKIKKLANATQAQPKRPCW